MDNWFENNISFSTKCKSRRNSQYFQLYLSKNIDQSDPAFQYFRYQQSTADIDLWILCITCEM